MIFFCNNISFINANGGRIFLNKISPLIEYFDYFLVTNKPRLLRIQNRENENSIENFKNLWVEVEDRIVFFSRIFSRSYGTK